VSQPQLHDLTVSWAAPSQVWSAPDHQIHASGVQGAWYADTRVLSEAIVTIGDVAPRLLRAHLAEPSRTVGRLLAVDPQGHQDAGLELRRVRSLTPEGELREQLTLHLAPERTFTGTIELRLGCDLAGMPAAKAGRPTAPLPIGEDLVWRGADRFRVEVRPGPGARADLADRRHPRLSWDVALPAGGTFMAEWSLQVTGNPGVVRPPAGVPEWTSATLRAEDKRLERWFHTALGDLAALRMTTSHAPGETFLAAGAPWFFTLFGRDSLWAARMLLPLGTELAGSTLRALAAVQGRRHDSASGEQPGKIPHEIRHETWHDVSGAELAPVYYGSIDAAPLWIILLVEAWRRGLPPDEVRALTPALLAALDWMRHHGCSERGFLEYSDPSGHGLSNQGWKDSAEALRRPDGTLPSAPIALCEVQAYAYQAAMGAAELLEALGDPSAHQWRTWGGELADRFRREFWARDSRGSYPVLALDGAGQKVEVAASNMGHLLGTGLLTPAEEGRVAERLLAPALDGGGIRTIPDTHPWYWPLSYHGGATWPHDTAIAIRGLIRGGFTSEALVLAERLLAAAEAFDYRLPELYSGDSTTQGFIPHPTACLPQAWSAAAAVEVALALPGVQIDGEHSLTSSNPADGQARGIHLTAADCG